MELLEGYKTSLTYKVELIQCNILEMEKAFSVRPIHQGKEQNNDDLGVM